MKKLLLTAASLAVAFTTMVAAPTTSEAIPAFARQTGAACLACHHLTFPTLSAFGRQFKQGAFTDVGELALIEDEDLSITSVLNFSIVLRQKFISTTTDLAAGGTQTVKSTTLPADTVLLFGGRVTPVTGAFIEYEAGFANYQLINSWDFDGFKAGVSFFNSGFGDTFGIEVGSTYGQHGGLFGAKEFTAIKQMQDSGKALFGGTGGVALFAANDWITASVSGVVPSDALGGTENGWKLAPAARIFAVQEFSGQEFGLGFAITNGEWGNAGTIAAITANAAVNPAAAAAVVGVTSLRMEKWVVDFQIQGELADMGFDVYAEYSSAAAHGLGEHNYYNSDTSLMTIGTLEGYSLRADIKPLHNVIFGAGFGRLSNDLNKRTQWQVAAEYELYQNMTISLIHRQAKTTVAGLSTKVKTTTLDIEALM